MKCSKNHQDKGIASIEYAIFIAIFVVMILAGTPKFKLAVMARIAKSHDVTKTTLPCEKLLTSNQCL